MKGSWIPIGSFCLAVLLASLVGPPTRLSARAAAESSAECEHKGVAFPGMFGTIFTPGPVELNPPVIADFDPVVPPERLPFFTTTHIAKDQDASVCIRTSLAATPDHNGYAGRELSTVSGNPQAAHMEWSWISGTGKCCHGLKIDASGLFRGHLEISEPHQGASGTAMIGRGGDEPITVDQWSSYDQNCNNITDYRLQKFKVNARMKCTRERQALPTLWWIIGMMQTNVTEIVDNTGVQMLPVRVEVLDIGGTRGRGAKRDLDRQYGYNITKAFDYGSLTTLSILENQVSAENNRTNRVFPRPMVSVGASFFTNEKLSSTDTTENKLVEIPKKAFR